MLTGRSIATAAFRLENSIVSKTTTKEDITCNLIRQQNSEGGEKAVNISTGLRAGTSVFRIPAGARDFSSQHPDLLWSPLSLIQSPVSYSVGSGVISQG
jgi:hypothetical protein